MKLSAALFALGLASAALAQDVPTLPECAQNCANKFLQEGIGNCGSDPACICANKDFIGEISCCLVGVCSQKDQEKAVNFASSFCASFKVTGLPTTPSCSTVPQTSAATIPPSSTASSASATDAVTSASTSAGSSATDAAAVSSTEASNVGPRPTAAAVGLGAIGGVMAAVALL